MGDKLLVTPSKTDRKVSEVTGTNVGDKTAQDVIAIGGMVIDPAAKYVEAIYSNGDQTVTYNYYESSSKATSYGSITTNFSVAQDTSFTSAEWS